MPPRFTSWLSLGVLFLVGLSSRALSLDDKVAADTAVIVVTLPADARLTVNGSLTKTTGTERQFTATDLKVGKQYSYSLVATWTENGKPREEKKKVLFTGGQTVRVVFGASRSTTTEGEKEVLALLGRAEALEKTSKLGEAISVREKLVEKAKEVYGATSLTAAAQMNNLARLFGVVGHYEKAEPLYLRALKVKEDRLGKDHPEVATSLNNLALLYQETARYAKAETLYLRTQKIDEDRYGKDHPDVATSLNNLAGLYRDTGRYEKADPLLHRALKIREDNLGKDHPAVAQSLNNLAALYRDMGRDEKAETLYLGALKIYENKLIKNHPDVAASLNNLAGLYLATGRYEKAELLLLRALKIVEENLGKDHPHVALTLNSLALLYHRTGRYEKAEPLNQRALKIVEARLGKDHPHAALPLNNLAMLYRATRRYEKAEPLYLRALKIEEDTLGKYHPSVTLTLNNLAVLYATNEQPGQAAETFDRARRGGRRHLFAILPALSEPDRIAFFENRFARKDLESSLSLSLTQKSDRRLAALSASWLLNGKAPEQESLAAAALMTRQSSDPVVGRFSTQLLAIRGRLARLTFSTPRPGQEKQRLKLIEDLTAEEQELAKQLWQAGSKAAPPAWVEMADLRKSLPTDGVLIDIARLRVFDFKGEQGKRWQPARYVAWVTPAKGDAKVIELGPADKIDAAIKAFRQAIEGAARQLKEGEEKAEQALRKHLEALSKLVLEPLLPHISKSKRWFVSPDGNLWLVPFEALPLKDGKYAIENYHISYLTSGRDLVPLPAPKVKVTAPLVLADPDFDLTADDARAEAKKLGITDEEETRSASGTLRLGDIRRLLSTGAEAKAITPSLKRYAGTEPRVYLRGQALEAVFKSVRNPRVVVLATHGFFLPDREKSDDDKGGKGKPNPVWENPLLRCGLLLAGCNKAKGGEGDDGVLTGLEVVGTDLRGCELVVLSACDTGVGNVQSGEGVAGLRQAFQLAGAQAVVSTLWQVPDKSSARLMTLFFDTLSQKKLSKADALRAAKLQLIEERRKDFAAAHPFYWAAFTLTGE